jgi:pimeloyl-ACP methyl ester carboxylesterase
VSTAKLKTHTVDAGGFPLQVDEAGNGLPVLVFLHYWGGSARTWSSVIERIAGTVRCVAYDQRGWGRSGGPAKGYAISDLATDLATVVSALDLDDYVLVGHSMGGKVAQAAAAEHPGGLRGLALVAPAPASPKTLPDEARAQMLSAYENRDSVIATLENVLSHKKLSDALRAQVVEDSLAGTTGAQRTWPTSAIAEDVSANVGTIDVPVLILAGEHDLVEPVEFLRETVARQIPGAEFRVIKGIGHLVPLEGPEELTTELRAFIEGIGPSASAGGPSFR